MTRHDIGYVAKTAAPMFLIMVVMVFILIAAPELATWLPENMRAAPGGEGRSFCPSGRRSMERHRRIMEWLKSDHLLLATCEQCME